MELLHRPIGPLATNVYVLGDPATREALAIDAAIPCLEWVAGELADRGWSLRLIISTHGHWDHTGDNARLQAWSEEQASHAAEHGQAAPRDDGDPGAGSPAAGPAPRGARVAVHPLDAHRLTNPQPLFAPFPIPPSVPAVDLAEGDLIRFGSMRLRVLHTPGHTEGSVCLHAEDDGLLFSGDTLFRAGWGRVDLPGGSAEQMVESLARLAALDDGLRVLPGHGPATTIAGERPLLELVARERRLLA